jgi:hypothetical protein
MLDPRIRVAGASAQATESWRGPGEPSGTSSGGRRCRSTTARRAQSPGDIERASAGRAQTKTARPGERTYLALGRGSAIAIHEGRGAAADDAVARALDALAGGGAPLAEWRVHAVAAAGAERARARDVATRHWARSAEALRALADSLGEDDAEIRASLLESPVARSVLAGSASRGGRTTA